MLSRKFLFENKEAEYSVVLLDSVLNQSNGRESMHQAPSEGV